MPEIAQQIDFSGLVVKPRMRVIVLEYKKKGFSIGIVLVVTYSYIY